MGPFKDTYKVHSSKLNLSPKKSESKYNIKPKEIVSKVKSSKLLSKIRTLAKREKVLYGPRTWMDHWKDNVPVISASKEFYGVPQAIIELLWTHVIESDEEELHYYIEPSLIESMYHYDHSKDSSDYVFKVKMTGARTLTRIYRFSRSLALKKLCGTLPILYMPFSDIGIFRFDPKRDIIHIWNFYFLAGQMTPTFGMGVPLDEHLAQSSARELWTYHPKFRHVRKRFWIARQAKYIYYLFKQREQSLETRQVDRSSNEFHEMHELQGGAWRFSNSIQHLVIDYTSLCKSILAIHETMDTIHTNTPGAGTMPEFTAEFGPVSDFFRFLREIGNVRYLRVGDDKWHKLSDEELFNSLLEGQSALLDL
ncbi:hypothetical protein BPOR_0662g00050 [Botrytis porri]|uniref:Uncharacterized protein n=1 Tax=Botrytis porri TaxID=87229 RepID=A0A4Z1KAY8_9HELO|nr:hypothetical protein BPOR_0662g00050 [Botrytis porri]